MTTVDLNPPYLKLVSSDTDESTKGELRLRKALTEYFTRLTDNQLRMMRPGSIVRWKSGLKNRKWPDYGDLVVVIEIIDPPILDIEGGAGSCYYREPLSGIIGWLDEEGDFLAFHSDLRRYEIVT